MGKGGIGREIVLKSVMLDRGRSLSEEVDDGGDVVDWIFHAESLSLSENEVLEEIEFR